MKHTDRISHFFFFFNFKSEFEWMVYCRCSFFFQTFRKKVDYRFVWRSSLQLAVGKSVRFFVGCLCWNKIHVWCTYVVLNETATAIYDNEWTTTTAVLFLKYKYTWGIMFTKQNKCITYNIYVVFVYIKLPRAREVNTP